MIKCYQVNIQTVALHQVTSKKVYTSDFANEKDAQNYAEFIGKNFAKAGYYVNINYQLDTGEWKMHKRIKV